MYTFQNHRDRITHLMVLDCFDEDGPVEPFAAVVEKTGRFARSQGKTLLPVSTNARQVTEAGNIAWEYLHGPLLCTLAVSFGADFYYIPGSNTARGLKPWGSHPLTDPLWATGVTGIEHEGLDAFRTDKTCAIAEDPALLRDLQVCWNSKVSNCGKCSKCARTMLVLAELGIRDAPFPPFNSRDVVQRLGVVSDQGVSHIWDLWQFMKKRGNHEMATLLGKRIDKYLLKRSRDAFVKALIGRRGQNLYHRWRGSRWRTRRIILRDPDNFE